MPKTYLGGLSWCTESPGFSKEFPCVYRWDNINPLQYPVGYSHQATLFILVIHVFQTEVWPKFCVIK